MLSFMYTNIQLCARVNDRVQTSDAANITTGHFFNKVQSWTQQCQIMLQYESRSQLILEGVLKVFIRVSRGWCERSVGSFLRVLQKRVDYYQALSVICAWVAPLSFPGVHIAESLCHFLLKLYRYTLLCPCLNSCGAAWTGQAKVVLKDRPVMWLMTTLYLQPCKGRRRVNLSSPLCQQQASQSAIPHWPLSQLRTGNEIFGNQTIRLPLVFCFLSSVW